MAEVEWIDSHKALEAFWSPEHGRRRGIYGTIAPFQELGEFYIWNSMVFHIDKSLLSFFLGYSNHSQGISHEMKYTYRT